MRTAYALAAILLLLLTACADTTSQAGDVVASAPSNVSQPTAIVSDAPADTAPADTQPAQGDQYPDSATQDTADTAPSGEPIPVEGDGGIGDGAGPPGSGGQDAPPVHPGAPTFGVSSETDSGPIEPYTYCWTQGNTGECSDGTADPQAAMTADAQLVVTYEVGELTVGSSARVSTDAPTPERSPLPVLMENPGIWLVDVSGLEPGDHTVWLSWTGKQGDSSAVVDVTIAH